MFSKHTFFWFLALLLVGWLVPTPVAAQNVTNLQIYPKSITVEAGKTVRFTAVATTDQGTSFTPRGLIWSTTGGTIDKWGRFTAGNQRTRGLISVQYGTLMTRTRINIKINTPPPTHSGPVASIKIHGVKKTLTVGETLQLKAVGYDSRGRAVSFNPIWTCTGSGTVDNQGTLTATQPGNCTVIAVDPKTNKFGSAELNIVQNQPRPPVRSGVAKIEVTPTRKRLSPGEQIQFSYIAYDHNGQVTGAFVHWSATGGTINRKGLFTAGQQRGRYKVTAFHRKSRVSGEARIYIRGNPTSPVVSGPIVRMVVSPSSARVKVGETLQLTAKGYNDQNQEVPFTPIWTAMGGGNIDTNGLFTATTPGTHSVMAVDENSGKYASTELRVYKSRRHSLRLVITPNEVSLDTGQEEQFQVAAFGRWNRKVSVKVIWRCTGGTIDRFGNFQAGPAPGKYEVWAKDVRSGTVARAQVRIKSHRGHRPGRYFRNYEITPAKVKLKKGESAQFQLLGVTRRGQKITLQPKWKTTGNNRIDETGKFLALDPGKHTVQALSRRRGRPSRVRAEAQVLVLPRFTRKVFITPSNPTVYTNHQVDFNAKAVLTAGKKSRTLPVKFIWQVRKGGTIDGNGVFTAGNETGKFRVYAYDTSKKKWFYTTVEVIPAPKAGIEVLYWKTGSGNVLRPKARVKVKVTGHRVRKARLYSVGSFGRKYQLLQEKECKHGDEVYFRTTYRRTQTRWIEVRTYSRRGRVISKVRRRVR